MRGHVYRRCPRPLAAACSSGRCDHRWAWTFSNGSDPVSGRRRQHTAGGFRSKDAAERELRTAIGKAEAGELLLKREQRAAAREALAEAERAATVKQFGEKWLPRKSYRPNTRDGHQLHLTAYINPAIGSLKLTEVTRQHIRDLLEGLAEGNSPKTGKPRSKATIARVRATVTKMFEDAVDEGLLTVNPARSVKLPERAPDTAKEMETFTPDQARKFLAAAVEDPLGELFHLALNTALRRGELVGLRWADVELEAKPQGLKIRHSITQRGGELRHGKPKTKKGERFVALDAYSVERLKRHRKAQASLKLAAGPAWAAGDLVFPREDGTPQRPDTVTRRWKALCKKAGVPEIRLHDGRHTHASLALEAGVDVKIVSERLGHSTTTITRDIYQHVNTQLAGESAEQIAALLRPQNAAGPAS